MSYIHIAKLKIFLLLVMLAIGKISSVKLFASSDDTTLSNFSEIVAEHVVLDFEVDFKSKKIIGTSHTKFVCKQEKCSYVILDIRDVDILNVYESTAENPIQEGLNFERFTTEFEHGEGLKIFLPRELLINEEAFISVEFIHKNNNPSIVWMSKENTDSGNMLYTMTKPIYARALFPCMDTPMIKSTYSARIVVPDETYTVVFSGKLEKTKVIPQGSNKGNSNKSKIKFFFSQTVRIPSFLVGFVIGRLEKEQISPRVEIFSEKHIITKSINHLINVDEYIGHAETYLTKFVWGKLHLVVMPKGFPHTGIGSANLILLSPNVLDDKENIFYNLLHEIVQSWIGNLVTKSCWRHYSLSKGLATYVERKIIHEVEDKEFSEVHKNIGEIEMYELLENLGENNHKTSLYPDVSQLHPSEYMSKIAHEKGYSFFSFLDQGVGRHVVRENIKLLIKGFKNHPVGYGEFAFHYIDHIRQVFKFRHAGFLGQIDWEMWVTKTGPPVIDLYYDSNTVEKITDLIQKLVHLEDKETLIKDFDNLPFIAKSVLLKRLNKFDVVENGIDDDDEFFKELDNYKNETENIHSATNEYSLDEELLADEIPNKRRQRYLKAQTHPKRHLDRAHSRRLNVDSLKHIVKNIQNNQSLENNSLKFELILLGLKAKVDYYKKMAEDFISSNSQIKYLRPIYRELAKDDIKLAKQILSKNKYKYLSSTVISIENEIYSKNNNS